MDAYTLVMLVIASVALAICIWINTPWGKKWIEEFK